MKKIRIPAVLLAAALQLAPMYRTVCTSPAVGSTFAIVFRWAVAATATFSAFDAVSAPTDVVFTMANSNVTGTVGVPLNYTLSITNYKDNTGAYFFYNTNAPTPTPLPPGLSITTYDHAGSSPKDVHGNVVGTPTTATNMLVRVTANYNDGGDLLTVFTNIYISISAAAGIAPVITNQPVSLTNLAGSTPTFSVLAGGTAPLKYQWRRFVTNILANATNTSLSLTNVRLSQAGDYTVVITNSSGAKTSTIAQLTVNIPSPPSLTPVEVQAGKFVFTFVPVVGLTNTVLTNTVATSAGWGVLTNIPPPATAASISITNTISGTARFYRVVFSP